MIPEQTLVQFPEFSDSGTKVKPGDAKYSAGFQEADVLPAEWLNWFLNKASDGISVINSGVASMEKELNNIVTETGDTPAEGTNNQVVTSIKKLRDAITGTLSNLSTTAKTSLVAAINEVDGDVGALTSLTTTAKTSLVAALNEVVTNVGTLSSLTTTEKTSLVAAINELVTGLGTKSAVTLNGSASSTPSFYAPAGAGTAGQILKSTGSGAPDWVDPAFFSGVCTTAASTAEKAVTVTSRAFRLVDGVSVRVLFTNLCSATTDVSLNVNSTGAKTIKVCKAGTLISIPRKSAKWGGASSATTRAWDGYTVLDLIYYASSDVWVVSGNPVVCSYSTTGTTHNSYRVYADGYKEQWGKVAHGSEATINFDISFTNTPAVISNPDYETNAYSSTQTTLGLFAHNIGTAGFAITTNLTSSYPNQIAYWSAKGY